jgi:hypothetical protein
VSKGRVAFRLLVSHLLAYPVAMAWAVASVPAIVVALASRYGTSLDDEVLVHRALGIVLWPAVGSFVCAHALGVAWARAGDDRRGSRAFAVRTSLLTGVAVVAGGASWIWLMTR